MGALRLLLVEDNLDDADLVLAELHRSGVYPEWTRVETEADFLIALESAPDIILSDYAMPRFSGLRAMELLRSSGRDIPLILVSGTVGEEVAVQAMRGGATDYLLKDRLARLPTAVRSALERRRLEEQVQQAQKMEAIGRLAGGVAHDFNNLLTAILGFCELLLAERPADDPGRPDIAEIKKAATRAAGLTRQLLAFSRKQIIEPTLLDLNGVVVDLRSMLGRLIGEDVTIVLSLEPALGVVRADRGQIEQIIMNLAVNARDAMPGGGTLTIETSNAVLDERSTQTHVPAKPGSYVALVVSDTGTGMTPDVQARLFEPFFTTKERGEGTGLGMSTVYGIVTRSGGSLGVRSEVGKGTTFTVYFPTAQATEIVSEPAALAPLPREGALTILVVDDEDGIRELAKRLLERLGYTVLVAATAEDALRLSNENGAIDILLTDVVMPGGSGPDLAAQLIERRPGLRVIYMSGYTEHPSVHHGVLGPGIAFLSKPYTSETLVGKIRELLDA